MAENKLIIQAKKYRGDTSVVSVRMPNELVRRMDEIAQKTGRTRNDIILSCLEYAVDRLEIQDN